ncbi:radical SAM protein [Gordonia alkanivorans]|uniref:radical SAM protein n=1 Tax=Gordonia alkanivorans TaxID=84096 RepID=UPI001F4EB430|nr:radical SAM protein [Gordonia alkanivorans]
MYNLGDDSWKAAPAELSDELIDAAADRIREHAQRHGLRSVAVSIHGGEPLLRGISKVENFAARIRSGIAPVRVEISMQTNATLVTEAVAERLAALDIHVGVSLDGGEEANSHRLDLGGKSSFNRVVRGISHMAEFPGLIQGALAVIDLVNDPGDVYGTIKRLGFTSLDVLLPHGTWEALPVGKGADRNPDAPAPYGDWLIELYKIWSADESRTRLRLFDDIIHLLLGGEYSFESLGLAPAQLVTIESNGDIELVDSIGFTYEGAATTGANVLTNELDEILEHPGVVCRQIGASALPTICQECPVLDVCGGGLISHRWDSSRGFKNQTVYCSDMKKIIAFIDADIGRRTRRVAAAGAGASV